MTAPPPTRPTRHRASPPLSQTVQRVLPPLVSVTAVVAVIVILLVLNSRPSHPDAGPAVVPPSTSPSATASSASPSVKPSSPSPSARHSSAPAPPVSEPSATQPPVVAQPPVTVLNNSRRQGLAAHVAAELRSRGWPIQETGNFTGRIVATTAYYPPGEQAAAQRLAREFPQVQRVEPRFAGLPGSGLTLVVTRFWTG